MADLQAIHNTLEVIMWGGSIISAVGALAWTAVSVIHKLQLKNIQLEQKNMGKNLCLKIDGIVEDTRDNKTQISKLWDETDGIKKEYVTHREHDKVCPSMGGK